jgi:hypothetical protein
MTTSWPGVGDERRASSGAGGSCAVCRMCPPAAGWRRSGDPVGRRICQGRPGDVVASDDSGERRRGDAAAPRVTVRHDGYQRADVSHRASIGRAGLGRVPLGPVQCPQVPVLLSLRRLAKRKGCRGRHASGSHSRHPTGLASTAAFALSRTPWAASGAVQFKPCVRIKSFHRGGRAVRCDFGGTSPPIPALHVCAERTRRARRGATKGLGRGSEAGCECWAAARNGDALARDGRGSYYGAPVAGAECVAEERMKR